MSAASGAPVGMEVDKEGKEGEEKKGETPEEDDRATRRSLEALRDYERKRSEAYAHVSARSVLESIDSDGKRRADAIQKQRDYAKRAFEEAMGANPDHELRTGEPFADDDEFNDLCKHLDHLSMLNVLAYRLARHYRRATRNNRITSNIEAILARVDEATKADSTVSLGELRYKGVAEMMNEIARIGHLKREQAQMTFLHEFQIACAPLAYGADWETHKLRFMIKWKLSRIDRMVLCMAPRRFGKTWAVAWFCLAFMLVVPGIRIAIFSQNQRTSASICEQLHQWLFCLPGGKDRSCSDSKTKVSVISEAAVAECRQARDKVKHPSKSTTLALPTTANGTYTPLPPLEYVAAYSAHSPRSVVVMARLENDLPNTHERAVVTCFASFPLCVFRDRHESLLGCALCPGSVRGGSIPPAAREPSSHSQCSRNGRGRFRRRGRY